jgi:hypothetical protein
MTYQPGEPEPTVPFEWPQQPSSGPGATRPQPRPGRYEVYPDRYQEPPGYPGQTGYPGQSAHPAQSGYPGQTAYPGQTGYPVVQPSGYGRVPDVAPGYGYPVDPRQQAYQDALYSAQKSRVAAGLLALFLGCFGIHNFYLGRTGIGVLQLLLTVLSLFVLSPLVGVWVLIEAILILSRSPSFATDAKGIPLRD